jgi:SAM-dependent methyltransferase
MPKIPPFTKAPPLKWFETSGRPNPPLPAEFKDTLSSIFRLLAHQALNPSHPWARTQERVRLTLEPLLDQCVPPSNRAALEKQLGPLPNLTVMSATDRLHLTVAAIRNDLTDKFRSLTQRIGVPPFVADGLSEKFSSLIPSSGNRVERWVRDDQRFLEDLASFIETHPFPNAKTIYVGSAIDQSFRHFFPDAIHADPVRFICLPKGFNFVCAHGQNLPFQEASFDLVLYRHFPNGIGLPKLALEAHRILKPGGALLSHGNILGFDFQITPKKYHEAAGQNRSLRELTNLLRHGFRILHCGSNGLIAYQRGEDFPTLQKLERAMARNRAILFDLALTTPGVNQWRASGDVLAEFNLSNADLWALSREDCQKKLETLRPAIPPALFESVAQTLEEGFRRKTPK